LGLSFSVKCDKLSVISKIKKHFNIKGQDMTAIIGLFVILCFIGAYFQRGWNRAMLILLALAVIQLKSLAVGMKLFSLTVIIIVLVYFLSSKKRE